MRLFEPAWKGFDFEKGLRAVKRERSQSKLCEIAEEAMYTEQRLLAAAKLDDQTLAQKVFAKEAGGSFITDKETGFFAIDCITDQNVLANLVISHTDHDMCQRALNRITDQPLLASVVTTGKYKVYHTGSIIRQNAVDRIHDQAILADLAKRANESWAEESGVSYKAVPRITDQHLLAEVALSTSWAGTGADAASRITDKDLLADVVKNAKFDEVRKAAAKKLSVEMEG